MPSIWQSSFQARASSAFSADLRSVISGRALDDDATVLLDFVGGAPGVILASQIATGEANGLRLRVYGERAALDWKQEQPNRLELRHASGRSEVLVAGDAALGSDARQSTRLPPGHPEGYIEAFANLYADFGRRLAGQSRSAVAGDR